jgi:hypothetical protein
LGEGHAVRIIDIHMAELAALRADLQARVGTDCPLRPAGEDN